MRDVILSAYFDEHLTASEIATAYGLKYEDVKRLIEYELKHETVD